MSYVCKKPMFGPRGLLLHLTVTWYKDDINAEKELGWDGSILYNQKLDYIIIYLTIKRFSRQIRKCVTGISINLIETESNIDSQTVVSPIAQQNKF